MKCLVMLFISVIVSCCSFVYGMDGVTFAINFDSGADGAKLRDITKHVQCKVQFDPTQFAQLVDVSDDGLIRQESNQILTEGINLMGNVQVAPFKYINGAKVSLNKEETRCALARKCIALAVLRGAAVDAESNKVTALWRAVCMGDYELASLLVAHGANPNLGTTPAFYLVRDIQTAQLLQFKADYSLPGPGGSTVLHHIMRPDFPIKMVAWYCKEHLPAMTTVDHEGITPLKRLMIETMRGDYDLQTAGGKMGILLTAITNEDQRRSYAFDALIFAKFRSRPHQPGKQHRDLLEEKFRAMKVN